jgi:hypothetical protein
LKTLVFECHPEDALDETVLIPINLLTGVEIPEGETVNVFVGSKKFLVSKSEWNAATTQ